MTPSSEAKVPFSSHQAWRIFSRGVPNAVWDSASWRDPACLRAQEQLGSWTTEGGHVQMYWLGWLTMEYKSDISPLLPGGWTRCLTLQLAGKSDDKLCSGVKTMFSYYMSLGIRFRLIIFCAYLARTLRKHLLLGQNRPVLLYQRLQWWPHFPLSSWKKRQGWQRLLVVPGQAAMTEQMVLPPDLWRVSAPVFPSLPPNPPNSVMGRQPAWETKPKGIELNNKMWNSNLTTWNMIQRMMLFQCWNTGLAKERPRK